MIEVLDTGLKKLTMSDLSKIFSILLSSFIILVVTYAVSSQLNVDSSRAYLYGSLSFNILFVVLYTALLGKSGSIYPAIKVLHFEKNKLIFSRGIFTSIAACICITLVVCLLFDGKINEKYQFAMAVSFFIFCQVFFEEVFYTGIVFHSFRKKFNPNISLIATSIVFALSHLSTDFFIYKVVSYIFFSVLMCIWASYYKNLIPGIIFHAFANFINGVNFDTGPASINTDPIILLLSKNKFSYILAFTTMVSVMIIYYIFFCKALRETK